MDLRPSLLLAAIAACLAWAAMLWAWPSTAFVLCFDDSFYYFEIARNVAAGFGSTFDRINATNGYHPLWLLLCVPAYAAGLDGMVAVRALLTGQLAMYAGVLAMASAILARGFADWPRLPDAGGRETARAVIIAAFALLIGSPFVVKAFANGMESAPYALCYTALLVLSDRHDGDLIGRATARERTLLGALGALAFLSRTDAGLLLLCLGLWSLPAAARLGAAGLLRLAHVFGPPALTLLAFLAYNQAHYGIAMQVSGELKRTPPGAAGGAVLAGCGLLVAVAAWRLRRFTAPERATLAVPFPRVGAFLVRNGWFGAFVAMIFAYYLGLQTFPRLWYFGPAILFGGIAGLLGLMDLLERARLEAAERAGDRAVLPLGVLAVLPLLGGLLWQARDASDERFVAIRWKNIEAAEWIGANLPRDTVLASWDAGLLGYFAPQRVVNLDGVVNGAEWLEAMRSGGEGELLRRWDVRYVVNHGLEVDGQDPDVPRLVGRMLGDEAAAGLALRRSWPFVFHGSTNDLPHGEHPMAVFLYELPR